MGDKWFVIVSAKECIDLLQLDICLLQIIGKAGIIVNVSLMITAVRTSTKIGNRV